MPTWTLVYEGYEPKEERLREALCTLGNGYFCTRAAQEWVDADEDTHYPGTYIAGGYNRLITTVAGRPVENEDLVNMPNWLCLTFRIDDAPWFDIDAVEILSYRQELNVHEGLLSRSVVVRDGEGRETALETRRFVHMGKPHYAANELTITPRNWSGRMTVRSALDGRVINYGVARYRQLNSKHLEPVHTARGTDDVIGLLVRTNQSRIEIGMAARTRLFDDDGRPLPFDPETTEDKGYIAQEIGCDAQEGVPIRVEKVVSLYTNRDRAISEACTEAVIAVNRAGSFNDLLHDHKLAWGQIWRRCDIKLDRNEKIQMILRVHIFHLLQTVSRNTLELDVGVPARGLHGEAYRGHIFWDELYIFPFLNFRLPEITYALLRYRYRRLDEARAAARDAGYRGAMFPWQSGASGREETQEMHLNPKSGRWLPDLSRNQRHVNIAIAYNLWQYRQASGNLGFMSIFGAELLFEIARFWASIAHYNPERDRFEIHGVMGPDEYHEREPGAEGAGLRNNAYTNVMVSWTMKFALQAMDELLPYRRHELRETLQITDEEVSLWADMSGKMFVPFHENGTIIGQFEGYEDLAEFDWAGYRQKYGNIQRLDRILEAEGKSTNDYKLSKQADLLMLFYLFSEDEIRRLFNDLGYPLADDAVSRNIGYYSARTSHGSTLSNIVHSAVTARYDRSNSWKMFCSALESDLTDIQQGTTPEGIHLGAMAGTVDLVQRCYTGLEIRDGTLFIDPKMPEELGSMELSVRYRGTWLDLRLTSRDLAIMPRSETHKDLMPVGVQGRIVFLKPGYERVFPLD